MKFSLISIFALSLGAIAAPAPAPADTAIEKRAAIDDAYSICSSLYSEIKTYTGSINATSKSVSPSSSAADKSAAAKSVGTQLNDITAAVKAATVKVKALPKAAPVAPRQAVGPAELALLVEDIILEISGALNGIIADLGLQTLLSFLTPLVGSLSALLLSLEVVVNNLLALVQALVDGLLTGLSIGLAGLVL